MKLYIALLALTSLTTLPLAAVQIGDTSIAVGPKVSWLKSDAGDADLAGAYGSIQWNAGELLFFDASIRGTYAYQTSTDSRDLTRQDADVDFVGSMSALGILTPFASVGVSGREFDAPFYTGTDDWDVGYALGAGVGITILPGLLSITPSVRFVDSSHWDTLTYALDAQLHVSVVVLGLTASYEDNQSRDGEVEEFGAYAALSF